MRDSNARFQETLAPGISETLHKAGTDACQDEPQLAGSETVSLSDDSVEVRHDRIVEFVERMLELHRRLPKATGSALQRETCGVSL